MDFDYDSAKDRISNEFANLAEEVWPDIEKAYKKNKRRIPEDKIEAIKWKKGYIEDFHKKNMFSMLNELDIESYWHATDFWNEIRKNLTEEDEIFYANLMIEQAKRGHEEERLGYAWIVKNHDNGNLREFIPESLLEEAVNIGFWEIANQYFTGRGFRIPHKYYDTLMKYSEHLDLSRVDEFKTKPLIPDGDWIDSRYLAAFEEARKKLDKESGAWLAKPIIEQLILYSLSSFEPKPNKEELLAKETDSYREYFNTEPVQELFKERVEYHTKYLGGDDSFDFLKNIKILIKYLDLDESEIIELVSSSLPKDGYGLERTLVDIDFPKNLLNSETISHIKNRIIEYIDEKASKERKELIPHLYFLQDSIQKDWFDEKDGKDRIKNKLDNYLAQKRRPAGGKVSSLLNTLKPKLVDQELYRRVVHQGITDLVKRNRIEEASTWYREAEEDDWLEKSQVPDFELVASPKRIPKRSQTRLF
jgi:hypothetical protein